MSAFSHAVQQVHNISAARGGAWLRLFVKDLTTHHAAGSVEGAFCPLCKFKIHLRDGYVNKFFTT